MHTRKVCYRGSRHEDITEEEGDLEDEEQNVKWTILPHYLLFANKISFSIAECSRMLSPKGMAELKETERKIVVEPNVHVNKSQVYA